jgi:Rod binding domain-containing protein
MAFTAAEKKEMEVLMRKEIKDFLSSNTSKQFEDKLMDKISKELQRGGLRKDVKNIVIKSFQEYFTVMYQQRGFWEQKFRNA